MKFYQSLRFKITLAFIALMIAGNSISLFLANRSVTERYAFYVNESDWQRASMAAQFIARSWEKWQEDSSDFHSYGERNTNPMGGRGMGRNMMMDRSEPVPYVVTDLKGNVLFFSGPENQVSSPLSHCDQGVPVVVDGEQKAYVLAGSMINQQMSGFDSSMLKGINRVLILTNIISTLAILALGILLLGRMLAPLKKIDRAAAELGRGNYTVRTDVAGANEIGSLGIRFDEMARSLEASEEWKRRIIADTAHELRTPVSLVLSRLEMLKEGIYPFEESQLDILHREVKNFSRLIRDMQKLAGMEGGTASLEKSKGPVGAFCLNQIKSFLPESRKKDQTLLWNGAEVEEKSDPDEMQLPGPPLDADWNRLEQVLKNLLSNALRHTPEYGRIEVTAEYTGTQWQIAVSDSGPGIPEEERTRIFDRFYRLDKSRNRAEGGHGLGLAISKAIVDAHGGLLSAEQSRWGGAEFRIALPCR